MFAAGPATNIFAAFVCLLMLGGLAGQVVSTTPHPHARGVVADGGAAEAGMEPWDLILAINGTKIEGLDDFRDELNLYRANDTILMDVEHTNGERETLTVVLGDKYAYYVDDGWTEENLALAEINPGDSFLGVENLGQGTEGIDRITGPFSPRFEGGTFAKAVYTPIHMIQIMGIPFNLQGVSMYPMEESMLSAADDGIGSILGISGLMFLINFFFWLMWVNILLGMFNLIPIVPFDGGHLFKDTVHGTLNAVKRIGKRTKMFNLHPMWIEHVSNKTSRMSSLVLLVMVIFMIGLPFL
ncbi:MAG: M50 family metallopeptidase, partial [Candidatus Poseidoniaceae archaeon]|nr:M50 family metallopeptidase [Candidatus Poseidoniaceae archaeon]